MNLTRLDDLTWKYRYYSRQTGSRSVSNTIPLIVEQNDENVRVSYAYIIFLNFFEPYLLIATISAAITLRAALVMCAVFFIVTAHSHVHVTLINHYSSQYCLE